MANISLLFWHFEPKFRPLRLFLFHLILDSLVSFPQILTSFWFPMCLLFEKPVVTQNTPLMPPAASADCIQLLQTHFSLQNLNCYFNPLPKRELIFHLQLIPLNIIQCCHFLNYFLLEYVKVKVLDSLPSHGLQPTRLLCPWKFRGRILKWVAIPFSSGSSLSRNQTQVSCIAGRFLTIWASREAPYWSVVALQCCVSFNYTAKWISYM